MAVPVFPSIAALIGRGWPVKRTQRWSSVMQDALSGKRTRSSLFTYPTYAYELTFNVLRSTAAINEWQQLSDFISSLYGPTQMFAFDDANDDSVTNQAFGAGDGTTQNFQLVRTLFSFTEPVFLINGAPTIKVAGVTQVSGVDYNISATGNVAFHAAPAAAAALTWTGSYYWPCRFDEDNTDFSNFMQNLFELKTLKFSTEKIDVILGVAP